MNSLKDVFTFLIEEGIPGNKSKFAFLSEDAKIKVTDNVLNEMFKFISDKYNALDFAEIERSAGDWTRFKYSNLLIENIETLNNIYLSSSDPAASKYLDVIKDMDKTRRFLATHRDEISTLYKSGNGIIQIMYTSLVAALIYSVSALIMNTIRFVTTEENTDMQVLFDEIPGTIKHIHIRNIRTFAADIPQYEKMITTMHREMNKKGGNMNEAIESVAIVSALVVAGSVIYMIPKLIVLIREIIYSIYFTRVRTATMLELQVDLIRTNIESLEGTGKNKKVIARQKKIANRLESLKNKIAMKVDQADSMTRIAKTKENRTMRLEPSSPLAGSPMGSSDGLML